MVQAKIGDTVKVHYTGRLDDGSTFDTSMHCDPLEFTLGDGELIPGFEKAVLGMNPGDTKTVIIPAEQAYGAHRPEMVIEVDRQHLPPTLQPYVGQRLQMTRQDGTPVPVLAMAVTDAQVTLDANHPLAGKDLIRPQRSKPPQRPYPTPSCGACPAPAKAALHRVLRLAPGRSGGRPGGRGEKGRLDFLYVGRRAPASDKTPAPSTRLFMGSMPCKGGVRLEIRRDRDWVLHRTTRKSPT
jgi:peptidylprolyl isomerase